VLADIGRPPDRRKRWLSAPALVAALAGLLGGACAPTPSLAATPADTVATHAYLQADYEFLRVALHTTPAVLKAESKIAEGIGRECAGVLKGAPSDTFGSGPNSSSRRTQGEQQRSQQELTTINAELSRTLNAPGAQRASAAAETFIAAVGSLSWSNPLIAVLVRFDDARMREKLTPSRLDVCADMKAWAASSFHVLSPASKAFAAAVQDGEKGRPEGTENELLKPYEGPAERAIIKRTDALERDPIVGLAKGRAPYERLERELGVPEEGFQRLANEPILARGKTHAGATFILRRETAGLLGNGCRAHAIEVDVQEPSKSDPGSVSGGGQSLCLHGHSHGQPSENCSGAVLTVYGAVAPSVRTVLLDLSNGRTISARPIEISKKHGGPAGVFVQGLRSYSTSVVALTELDADGTVVRTVNLTPALRCPRDEGGAETKGPRFVSLAQGRLPDGESFGIQALLFSFGNHYEFSLVADAGDHGTSESSDALVPKPPRKAFEWSLQDECPPQPFAVIYGTLAPPGESVAARTPEGLIPLTKVALAAHLHSGGPLFFGAFSSVPSELIVSGSDGATLYSESLAVRDKEEAEFCEGYAEP
jgi:hypothetical protein